MASREYLNWLTFASRRDIACPIARSLTQSGHCFPRRRWLSSDRVVGNAAMPSTETLRPRGEASPVKLTGGSYSQPCGFVLLESLLHSDALFLVVLRCPTCLLQNNPINYRI